MSGEPSPGRARWIQAVDLLGLIGVLAALLLLFGSLSDRFLTTATLRGVVNQVPDLTVVAVGMTLVLVLGGIDLSVGSVLGLAGAVLGLAIAQGNWPVPLAIAVALAIAALCGLFNGLVTVIWGIPSFIVTLGMLEIARGAAYMATDSQTMYLGPRVETLAKPLPGLGISTAFVLALVLVVLGQFLLSRTILGRHLIAIGTNETAVRLSGIDPRPAKVAAFVLAGLLAGVGGVFQVARLASADPNAGIGLELSAIAAVVIGGTSLMGGRGSVIRSFLGVLIIAVLQTGLAQVGAQEPTKRIITGLVIVGAVIADAQRGRWFARAGRGLRRLQRKPAG